jgi:hypothetical protein
MKAKGLPIPIWLLIIAVLLQSLTSGAQPVTVVSAGGAFSLILKSDGSAWAMGYNASGQLGDGTFNNAGSPEQIVGSGVVAISVGGAHSLLLKSDGSLWGMGYDWYGELGDGSYARGYPYYISGSTNRPEQILAAYDQISGQILSSGNVRLSFVGIAGATYALDWSSSLTPANWVPQATNPASSFGALVFTNAPVATTNNFWRIRSVP